MLVAIKPLSMTYARFAVTPRRTYAVFDGYARLGKRRRTLCSRCSRSASEASADMKPNEPRVLALVMCFVAMLGAAAFLMLR
jgi:hypothetical protein